MKRRCYYKKYAGYHNYGGRGIKISKSWHKSKNFYYDMYASYVKHYKENNGDTQIDRIDVNGEYSKKNCRWVTQRENNRNRRLSIIRDINFDAQSLSKKLGGSSRLISIRIKKGWTLERAISQPKAESSPVFVFGKKYKTIKDAMSELNVSEYLYSLRRNCGYSIEEALSPEQTVL